MEELEEAGRWVEGFERVDAESKEEVVEEPVVVCPPGEDDAMNYTGLLRPAYHLTAKEAYATLWRNRSTGR